MTRAKDGHGMSQQQSASAETQALILQACAALFPPTQVVELRILDIDLGRGRRRGNAAGWFADHQKLAEVAARYDARTPNTPGGIYVTINPVHEACLARSANKVREFQDVTTRDPEILRRHWLPIDVDPVRPSGVSSSEGELAAAREVARQVYTYLEDECGWPSGIRALSGNGWHLLYRIDLPNDKESGEMVKKCLDVLDRKFSTPEAKVDTTLHNPARILKLYGTIARKGEEIDGRPHRRSRLCKTDGKFPVYGDCLPTSIERVETLAEQAAEKLPPGRTRRVTPAARHLPAGPAPSGDLNLNGEFAIDLEAFLRGHQIQVVREEPWDSTGVRYILQACVFDSSHTGTSAAIGRTPDGKVFYKCQHATCAGKGWRDVRDKLGPAPLTEAGKAAVAEASKKKRGKKDKGKDGNGNGNGDGDGDEVSDNPWDLAIALLAEEFTDCETDKDVVVLRRHREHWYRYCRTRKCYRVVDDDTMRVIVTRWLGGAVEKVTNRKVGDTLNCLSSLVTAPSEYDMPFRCTVNTETHCCTGEEIAKSRVICRNGIVELDMVMAGELYKDCVVPHEIDWFTTISLPFNFPYEEHEAKCPTWLAFLDEIFQGDQQRIAVLQEAFGSCFLPEANLEAFFVLHGAGRNGKGTSMNVLRALLSHDNTSSLSIEQIAHESMRFRLYGKVANISPDMNEMSKVEEGLLKAIVSGDRIAADRKYRDAVEFRPNCRLFFATNTLPRFVDNSQGIWRRMVLIPFDYIVPIERRDTKLPRKLEAELPGIFVWALEGARRLDATSRFTASDRCEDALREYRRSCLPVLTFLEESCERDDYATVVAGDLWKAYKAWCVYNGLTKPKPLHQLVKEVQQIWQGVTCIRAGTDYENRRPMAGLKLREYLPFGDVQVPADTPDYGEGFWNR